MNQRVAGGVVMLVTIGLCIGYFSILSENRKLSGEIEDIKLSVEHMKRQAIQYTTPQQPPPPRPPHADALSPPSPPPPPPPPPPAAAADKRTGAPGKGYHLTLHNRKPETMAAEVAASCGSHCKHTISGLALNPPQKRYSFEGHDPNGDVSRSGPARALADSSLPATFAAEMHDPQSPTRPRSLFDRQAFA